MATMNTVATSWSLATHVTNDVIGLVLDWIQGSLNVFNLFVGTGNRRLRHIFQHGLRPSRDFLITIRWNTNDAQWILANLDELQHPHFNIDWLNGCHLVRLDLSDRCELASYGATSLAALTHPIIRGEFVLPKLEFLKLSACWLRALASPLIQLRPPPTTIPFFLSNLEEEERAFFKNHDNSQQYQYGLTDICPALKCVKFRIEHSTQPVIVTDDFEAANWVRATAPLTLTELHISVMHYPSWCHRLLYLICHPALSTLAHRLTNFSCKWSNTYMADMPDMYETDSTSSKYDFFKQIPWSSASRFVPSPPHHHHHHHQENAHLPLAHMTISSCLLPHVYDWLVAALRYASPLAPLHLEIIPLMDSVMDALASVARTTNTAATLQNLMRNAAPDTMGFTLRIPVVHSTSSQLAISQLCTTTATSSPSSNNCLARLAFKMRIVPHQLSRVTLRPLGITSHRLDLHDTRSDSNNVSLRKLLQCTGSLLADDGQPLHVTITNRDFPTKRAATLEQLEQLWLDYRSSEHDTKYSPWANEHMSRFAHIQTLKLHNVIMSPMTGMVHTFTTILSDLRQFSCAGAMFVAEDLCQMTSAVNLNVGTPCEVNLTHDGLLALFEQYVDVDRSVGRSGAHLMLGALRAHDAVILYHSHGEPVPPTAVAPYVVSIDTRIVCGNRVFTRNEWDSVAPWARKLVLHREDVMFATRRNVVGNAPLPHNYRLRAINHQLMDRTCLGTNLVELHLLMPPPPTGAYYLHALPPQLHALVAPTCVWSFSYAPKDCNVFYFDTAYKPLCHVAPFSPPIDKNAKQAAERFRIVTPADEMPPEIKAAAITRAMKKMVGLRVLVLASVVPLEACAGVPFLQPNEPMTRFELSYGAAKQCLTNPHAYFGARVASRVRVPAGLAQMRYENSRNWSDPSFVQYESCPLELGPAPHPVVVVEEEDDDDTVTIIASVPNRRKRKTPTPTPILAQLEASIIAAKKKKM